MIMKNKKSIGYWLLEFRCQIFCILFFVFCSLAYSAAVVGQKSPQSTFLAPPDPNNNFRRQLWRAELSVAKDEKDKGTKNELKRIIEQIRSIKF